MSAAALPERGPIVLATDFGASDGYVGVMKGVVLGINPGARIVDLAHDLVPQDVRGAAFVLGTSFPYFPPRSIFVAVVDPGVGGPRRAIAVETPAGFLVGPDNGIFSWVIDAVGRVACRAVELTERRFWLPQTSSTFHGRDVFAPVAAHLSLGTAIGDLGRPIDDLVHVEFPRPIVTAGEVEGEVLRVDRFGNLVTNLRLADVSELGVPELEIAGVKLVGFRPYYASGVGLGAVVGSAGLIELAVTGGSAAAELSAGVGTRVSVRPSQTGRK